MKLLFSIVITGFVLSISAGSASAQHQPYAGMQTRPIKALSDQQLADLKAGRGMGLALAAELNGYPGPVHVLELSKELILNTAQREQIEKLFAAMKVETTSLGEDLIALETHLDHEFASRSITVASLNSIMAKIGNVQGSLRAAHLKYHLVTLNILTPEQSAHYAELRGYSHAGDHQHQ